MSDNWLDRPITDDVAEEAQADWSAERPDPEYDYDPEDDREPPREPPEEEEPMEPEEPESYTVEAQVTLHFKPGVDHRALEELARKIDLENGSVPPEHYTFIQAFQVVWHNEPTWIHENVLDGWTLDRTTDRHGIWVSVWPDRWPV